MIFRCAELLVMKAELELMQGEREESRVDLDKVRNLLELCTGPLKTQLMIHATSVTSTEVVFSYTSLNPSLKCLVIAVMILELHNSFIYFFIVYFRFF